MSVRVKQFFRRFAREEDGQMTIEFVLAVPLVFTLFMTSVELGIYTMRQMFLDRGMDMAVRDIRLNTGANFSHSAVKQLICDYSGFLEDCDNALRLSLNPVDLRAFNGFGGSADCVDNSQPIMPLVSFTHGTQHTMMLMRACYKFDPIFPTTGLGHELAKDGSGQSKMVSLSAFVQEPQ